MWPWPWPHRVYDLVFMTVCLQIIIAGLMLCIHCTKAIYIELYWKIAVKVTYTWQVWSPFCPRMSWKMWYDATAERIWSECSVPFTKNMFKKVHAYVQKLWPVVASVQQLFIFEVAWIKFRLFCACCWPRVCFEDYFETQDWDIYYQALLWSICRLWAAYRRIIACWWWERLSLILFSPIVVTTFNQLTLMKYPRIWSSSQHLIFWEDIFEKYGIKILLIPYKGCWCILISKNSLSLSLILQTASVPHQMGTNLSISVYHNNY